MSNLRRLLQNLWKSILTSNLSSKDKAEILRLQIFALVVISQLIVFVWLIGIVLDRF